MSGKAFRGLCGRPCGDSGECFCPYGRGRAGCGAGLLLLRSQWRGNGALWSLDRDLRRGSRYRPLSHRRLRNTGGLDFGDVAGQPTKRTSCHDGSALPSASANWPGSSLSVTQPSLVGVIIPCSV